MKSKIKNHQGKILIYGAGYWGRKVYNYIKYYVQVDGFVVTQKAKGEFREEKLFNLPVIELSTVIEKNALFILSATEEKRKEMIEELERLGCFDYFEIDSSSVDAMWSCFLENPVGGECTVCEQKVKTFGPFGAKVRYRAMCPNCGSLERQRSGWKYIKDENIIREGMTVLHFAPEKGIYENLKKMKIDYYPVDINPHCYGIRDVVNITDIPYRDDFFDVIICNHVIEHIKDEQRALKELKRVLKKDGVAFINVPIAHEREKTLENDDYNTDELRLKFYGQKDHVRLYGCDYIEHIEKFFNVKRILIDDYYSKDEQKRYALFVGDDIYVCNK